MMEPSFAFGISVFLLSLFMFAYLTFKVNEWETIFHLGYRSECPPMFLRWSSRPYNAIRLVTIICCLGVQYYEIISFGATTILIIVWSVSYTHLTLPTILRV